MFRTLTNKLQGQLHKDKSKTAKKDKITRKKAVYADYWDRTLQKPVIRSSICTGEKVAGFKTLQGGRFEDVMLIRNQEDLAEFMRKYGVKEEEITTEW